MNCSYTPENNNNKTKIIRHCFYNSTEGFEAAAGMTLKRGDSPVSKPLFDGSHAGLRRDSEKAKLF